MQYLLPAFLIVTASFIGMGSAFAQPNVQWKKCYGTEKGEYFAGMVAAHGGGFVFASRADSCLYNGDFQMIKIDDTSKVIWTKCYGGSSLELSRHILKVRGENVGGDGYLISGSSASNDGDVTGNHGAADFWIVKTDVNGNLQWQKSFGGSSIEEAFSATQTNDKNLVIGGVTQSNNGDVTGFHGGRDWWILRLDQSGGILWKKTLGGSAIEMSPTVVATNDGGVIVAGEATSSNGDITSAIGLKDIWVVKLDASGNKQWDKSFGSWQDDWAFTIAQTNDTGYIISAKTTDYPSTGINTALIKLNKLGQQEWAKPFSILYHIQVLPAGLIATGANSVGTVLDLSVYRLDDTGKILWQKSMGGSNTDRGLSVLSTNDGGYLVGGQTNSTDGDVTGNNGDWDNWVIKLAPDPLGVHNQISPARDVLVYPNPTKSEVRFSEPVNLRLTNLPGQQLSAWTDATYLDLSSYPQDVYFLTLFDEDGSIVKQEKLLKE